MKSLFFFPLCVLLLISCKERNRIPTPATDSSSLGLNRQAPFRSEAVPVKLHEVYYNGKLVSRYFYKDAHLSEIKNYVTYNDVKPWLTISFERNKGVLKSYEVKVASFSPEGRSVADLPKDGSIEKLELSENDSIQNIVAAFSGADKYNKKVFFDAKGFVSRIEDYNASRKRGYVYIYKRDSKNNIVEVLNNFLPEVPVPAKRNFRYDNHPNPYFGLGFHWQNDAISNYALTPNNIVEESGPGVKIDYEGKEYHVLSHEYEYLPNGYPRKDTAYITVVNPDGKEQKVVQWVMNYTYY